MKLENDPIDFESPIVRVLPPPSCVTQRHSIFTARKMSLSLGASVPELAPLIVLRYNVYYLSCVVTPQSRFATEEDWMKRVLVVVVMCLSFLLTYSLPASAAPYWQTYQTNSHWHCGPTHSAGGLPGVVYQTCMPVSVNGDAAQSVVIVTNNGGSPITISATVYLEGVSSSAQASCYQSTLNTGFSRACFGPTVNVSCQVGYAGSGLSIAEAPQSYYSRSQLTIAFAC